MSTAVFDVASSIPKRIVELKTLLKHAEEIETKNENLYNAICRASCVLIASHLEGFLKDLTESLVMDLNTHLGSFASMPVSMQRTFCQKIAYYEGVPEHDVESRIQQLIAFFSKNSVLIDMKAFTYKQNPNRNPSAEFIDQIFSKLGIPSIVHCIAGGKFDVIFDNDTRTDYLLIRDLIRYRSRVFRFPYRSLPSKYVFSRPKKVNGKKVFEKSIWHEYIEKMLERRHRIAHGDVMANETTWKELLSDTVKLDVLLHAILYSSSSFLGKVIK